MEEQDPKFRLVSKAPGSENRLVALDLGPFENLQQPINFVFL